MSYDWGIHNRFYLDKKNARLAGVCAGIADYFSWDVNTVRILAVVATFFFPVVTLALYGCAAYCLKQKPDDLYQTPEEESYWRHYRSSPRDTMSAARHRFRRLEHKINKLEAYVTSDKYRLDREFENMRKDPH